MVDVNFCDIGLQICPESISADLKEKGFFDFPTQCPLTVSNCTKKHMMLSEFTFATKLSVDVIRDTLVFYFYFF